MKANIIKSKMNILASILLAFFFLACASTALLLMFFVPPSPSYALFLGISKTTWVRLHSFFGIVFIVIFATHIVLHRKCCFSGQCSCSHAKKEAPSTEKERKK